MADDSDDDKKCMHEIMTFTVRSYYDALAAYVREHDPRLRDIQQKLAALYDKPGPTNFDLLALMGWIMYLLRDSGMPVGFVLSVLAEQADNLDERERSRRVQS